MDDDTRKLTAEDLQQLAASLGGIHAGLEAMVELMPEGSEKRTHLEQEAATLSQLSENVDRHYAQRIGAKPSQPLPALDLDPITVLLDELRDYLEIKRYYIVPAEAARAPDLINARVSVINAIDGQLAQLSVIKDGALAMPPAITPRGLGEAFAEATASAYSGQISDMPGETPQSDVKNARHVLNLLAFKSSHKKT